MLETEKPIGHYDVFGERVLFYDIADLNIGMADFLRESERLGKLEDGVRFFATLLPKEDGSSRDPLPFLGRFGVGPRGMFRAESTTDNGKHGCEVGINYVFEAAGSEAV